MRLLVCGSRDWTATDDIAFHLVLIFGTDLCRVVIHGNCGDLRAKPPRGADVLAGWIAGGVGAAVEAYPVDQRIDGAWPGCGPRRNTRMLQKSRPSQGLAFGALWERLPLGPEAQGALFAPEPMWTHTGTGDMVSKMLRAKVPARWIAAPGASAVDLVEMPRP